MLLVAFFAWLVERVLVEIAQRPRLGHRRGDGQHIQLVVEDAREALVEALVEVRKRDALSTTR